MHFLFISMSKCFHPLRIIPSGSHGESWCHGNPWNLACGSSPPCRQWPARLLRGHSASSGAGGGGGACGACSAPVLPSCPCSTAGPPADWGGSTGPLEHQVWCHCPSWWSGSHTGGQPGIHTVRGLSEGGEIITNIGYSVRGGIDAYFRHFIWERRNYYLIWIWTYTNYFKKLGAVNKLWCCIVWVRLNHPFFLFTSIHIVTASLSYKLMIFLIIFNIKVIAARWSQTLILLINRVWTTISRCWDNLVLYRPYINNSKTDDTSYWLRSFYPIFLLVPHSQL